MLAPQPTDGLLLPIARYFPLHISRLGQQSTMLVENKKFASDLSAFFGGRAAKPAGILTIPTGPGGTTPIMIAGLGECEAAEMEEIALEAIERTETQMKQTGTAIDFEAERERRGVPSSASFDQRVREMWADRAKLRATGRSMLASVPAKHWEKP